MADGVPNLTGDWWGNYSYPNNIMPTTPFIAKIIDSGASFSGSTIEADLLTHGPSIKASISGVKHGFSIDFIKTYSPDAPEDCDTPVDYVGCISEDGNAISGVWSLYDWDGTFEMFRETTGDNAEARQANCEVKLGV